MKHTKLIAALMFAFIVAVSPLTAQESHSPMFHWEYTEPVTLNGKTFCGRKSGLLYKGATFADSYCEQDGYALVSGRKLHYWLYDTYSYHDGDATKIVTKIIPNWVEDMGYVIDYDNVRILEHNPELANSVKILMKTRGCDVSVALVTKQNYGAETDYVVINSYDKDTGKYWFIRYLLYK